MKPVYLKIAVLLLSGLNILLLFRLSASNSFITALSGERAEILSEFSLHLRNAHVDDLPQDMYVTDTSGAAVLLRDIIGSGEKLVLRFSGTNCSKCIEVALDRLHALSQTIGREKIVVLASFSDIN